MPRKTTSVLKQRAIAVCFLLLFFLIPALAASCASPKPATPEPGTGSKSSARIKAEWLTPEVNESSVSIPVSEVRDKRMTHFGLELKDGTVTYMVYELDGEIFARASICPPCRSRSFSLERDRLVCDACATVFSARTGDGLSGACVAYPKAQVPYQVNGDALVFKDNDLITAYQDTLSPG